jgi:hypothetical protein
MSNGENDQIMNDMMEADGIESKSGFIGLYTFLGKIKLYRFP